MDPLSALSIACNVMQVVSFGLETISLCKAIYTNTHPDSRLADSGRHLEDLGASITRQLNQCSAEPTSKDKAFLSVAKQCADDAKALQNEIAYLAPKKVHEIRAAIGATGRSFWRRRKLERLEGNLARSQRTLETYMLGRLCDGSQAHAIQNSHDFAKLDQNLQHFVQQYADGQRTLDVLVQSSTRALGVHISDEATATRREVTTHISYELDTKSKSIEDRIAASTAEVSQQVSSGFRQQQHLTDAARLHRQKLDDVYNRRERLIGSLKWPDANARYNTLSDACSDTFNWVFDPPGAGRNDSGLLNWLRSDEKLFWISGKPGSGKSTFTKFMITHPETKEALCQWRESAIIASHFFWLPGSDMQKSIQGMLCSLLHQTLFQQFSAWDPEENLMPDEDSVMLQFPQLKVKTHPSDWSFAELMEVLVFHLSSSAEFYCFFLDGLDEVSPKDGPRKLLQVLDQLVLLPSVKVCVSSRPEYVFKNHFTSSPFLRMQDLIAPDIWTYAQNCFEAHTETSNLSHQAGSIIRTIVSKADGVFLWAVLVLESFKRGLSNGDSWDELQQRLETVPMDLMELYRDMWSRLNDDKAIYQKTAALYISLLIKHRTTECALFHESSNLLTVMDLAAASNTLPELDEFLGHEKSVPCGTIEEKCEQTIKSLNIRCAGLITTSSRRSRVDLDRSEWWQPMCRETSYGRLARYVLLNVDFIHRSAYDFLTDTDDGREIWKGCSLTGSQLLCRLVQGRMARYRIIGSFAPWMHDNGLTCDLGFVEPELPPEKIYTWLIGAIEGRQMTSADVEVLLPILSRSSIQRDLTFFYNYQGPTQVYQDGYGRPRELLALLFENFDAWVENYLICYADRLTAEAACLILVDMCSFSNLTEIMHSASFPETIRSLLRRIEYHFQSCNGDTSSFANGHTWLACSELVRIILSAWPGGLHRGLVADILTMISGFGTRLNRRVYLGLELSSIGTLDAEMRIRDVFYHPDEAVVLRRLPPDCHAIYGLRSSGLDAFTFFGEKDYMQRLILEMNVSLAMDCAAARHFGLGDRQAHVDQEIMAEQCRIVWMDDCLVLSEADDDDGHLNLKHFFCIGLLGNVSRPTKTESYNLHKHVWDRSFKSSPFHERGVNKVYWTRKETALSTDGEDDRI